MRSTFFPLELRFHTFFQFLLTSTKCHNPLENHGRNEHHIFFIFAFPNLFFGMAMENVVFTVFYCVLQCYMFFSEMVWSIELPFSSRKNLTFVRAETGKNYISHGWLKMCGTCQPFEVRFLLFCALFRSRTCDNALENHGRNEERTFFIFMSTKAHPPTPLL